jgi:hypothetical protein
VIKKRTVRRGSIAFQDRYLKALGHTFKPLASLGFFSKPLNQNG